MSKELFHCELEKKRIVSCRIKCQINGIFLIVEYFGEHNTVIAKSRMLNAISRMVLQTDLPVNDKIPI